ncbi:MAG: hypothetical protein ACP5MC_01030 [Candidatus Micrarchaeia archaeon]
MVKNKNKYMVSFTRLIERANEINKRKLLEEAASKALDERNDLVSNIAKEILSNEKVEEIKKVASKIESDPELVRDYEEQQYKNYVVQKVSSKLGKHMIYYLDNGRLNSLVADVFKFIAINYTTPFDSAASMPSHEEVVSKLHESMSNIRSDFEHFDAFSKESNDFFEYPALVDLVREQMALEKLINNLKKSTELDSESEYDIRQDIVKLMFDDYLLVGYGKLHGQLPGEFVQLVQQLVAQYFEEVDSPLKRLLRDTASLVVAALSTYGEVFYGAKRS